MLCYVYCNRFESGSVGLDRLSFIILQGFFAGQLKASVGGKNVFDPMNGAANGTFGAIVIVGDGLHRHVYRRRERLLCRWISPLRYRLH